MADKKKDIEVEVKVEGEKKAITFLNKLRKIVEDIGGYVDDTSLSFKGLTKSLSSFGLDKIADWTKKIAESTKEGTGNTSKFASLISKVVDNIGGSGIDQAKDWIKQFAKLPTISKEINTEVDKTIDKTGEASEKVGENAMFAARGVKSLKTEVEGAEKAFGGMISAADMVSTLVEGGSKQLAEIPIEAAKIGADVEEIGTIVQQGIEAQVITLEEFGATKTKVADKILNNLKEANAKEIVEGKETNETLIKDKFTFTETLEKILSVHESRKEKIHDLDLIKQRENKEATEKNFEAYKKVLESSKEEVGKHYDDLAAKYKDDSEEYRIALAQKKAVLKEFEAEEKAVAQAENNVKYGKAGGAIVNFGKNLDENVKEITGKVEKIYGEADKQIDSFAKNINDVSTGISKGFDATIKNYEDKKNKQVEYYQKKIDELSADTEELKKEKTKLEEEQAASAKRKAEYDAQIKALKDEFMKEEEQPAEGDGEEDANSELKDSLGEEFSIKSEAKDAEAAMDAEKDAERLASVQEKIDQLQELSDKEKELEESKAEAVKEANGKIIESEAQTLLDKVSLEEDKRKAEEDFQNKKEKLEKKKQKIQDQFDKIERAKEKAKHVIAIARAISKVAGSVTEAFAAGPFIGPVLAAVAAAQGAIQIKTMTEQLKYMEDGGLLSGKRHSSGGMRIEGTNIEVEGGEYVVNRDSTSKNMGLVRYINSQRKELTPDDINSYFAKGGQGYEPPFQRMFAAGGELPSIQNNVSVDNSLLVDAIKDIKFEPKVAVTDILRVQDEMTNVDNWAGM